MAVLMRAIAAAFCSAVEDLGLLQKVEPTSRAGCY